MSQTGYVQKKQKNKEQHYNFASEGDFIAEVRPLMVEAKLICYPLKVFSYPSRTPSEKQVLINGTATYRFEDVEDGSFIDIEVPYSGADSTDKAPYKAMTGARKYALRQAFLIETGDDPEKDEKPSPEPVKERRVEETVTEDDWLKFGKVLVKDIDKAASAAYAKQLDAMGLTNAEACKLIGVKSMKAERAANTLDEVIQEVAKAATAGPTVV